MAFLPRTNSEVKDWLARFHEVNDSLDASRLGTIYAKNITFQFANMPIVHGLENVKSMMEPQFARLEMMHHEVLGFDLVGNERIYQPCRITYRVKDDPEKETFEIPAMAVMHLVTSGEETGLIKAFEAYLDTSPVVAAIVRAS